MCAYMLDTNIFNHLLDGRIDVSTIAGKVKCLATHIQIDQLRATPSPERRHQLLMIFEEAVSGQMIPTESFRLDTSRLDEAKLGGENVVATESAVWDISAWDGAKWSGDDNIYGAIKAALDRKNGGKRGNAEDALIAETAAKNGHTLVTHDGALYAVATSFGIACANLPELHRSALIRT